MEIMGRFLKNLKLELPYDTAIPPMCIHPKSTHRGTGTYMFIAELFTTGRNGTSLAVYQQMNRLRHDTHTQCDFYAAKRKVK